jgi:phosphocarrier protein HPr
MKCAIVEPCDTSNKGVVMATRQVSIASSVGLHARPASLFVQAATATGLPVTIAKEGGNPVDARSILMVMALGAKHGETVTISAEGDGADAALDSLVELLSRDLDAE